MLRFKLASLLLMIFATHGSALAASLICSGKVLQVAYHSPDRFMLQLDSMNNAVFFCSTNTTWTVTGTTYTTGAETCRSMAGAFLAGKLADRTLTVVYDGDAVPGSCVSWGAWQPANIRYFAWID